ncbi:MAG: nucleoside kinase [Lachnospiraceae bacterium]|nr:nucleoside kinase [Lachnospiraceae bacterium]
MSDIKLTVKGIKEGKEEIEEAIIPAGTTFLELARKYQSHYVDDIVLAMHGNRLYELNKKIPCDGETTFITTRQSNGRRTYRRSVVLLMQKALVNLLPQDNSDIIVQHSLAQGYYCLLKASIVVVSDEFLNKLKDEMLRLCELDLPLEKYSVPTSEAKKIFHEEGLTDKERLMRYRSCSSTHIYNLDGFKDYFYGYMVPSTGYLKYFDLKKYDEGFMLLFPYEDTKKVAEFKPSHKLFQVQKNANAWSSLMKVSTVGALNDMVCSGEGTNLILMQEALMEQKIGALAKTIAKRRDTKFVMIAGPSSSGKTTFSYRLSTQLMACGLKPHPLSIDDYYIDRDKMPSEPDGTVDLESIKGIDVDQFNADMTRLLKGETVDMPSFNFKTGKREYRGKTMKLGSDDVLVIEGIHGLNEKMSYLIPNENKYKIYISALTQLAIDEHNPLSTTDGRLIRRIVRDARTRGSDAEETLGMWDSVRRGEENNIFPFQDGCDTMFNSALIYEMSVLKLYAYPLLMAIKPDSPQYAEAKRLKKLLDYFITLSPDAVNNTSLLREFIGGSTLNV